MNDIQQRLVMYSLRKIHKISTVCKKTDQEEYNKVVLSIGAAS
jgi:preprotein translocase subunit Sss1